MATLSNRTFFQGGVTPAESTVVGFQRGENRVVRYNLNLGRCESARHINVVFVGDPDNVCISWGGGYPGESEINEKMSFYFAISTDPGAFANAGYADIHRAAGKALFERVGRTAEGESKYEVSCAVDITLYPGTQYYFWVFPGFLYDEESGQGNWTNGWVYWNDTPIDVTLSGHVGIVWIKNSAGFEPTIPYVRQAGEWKQAVPYVRKNNTWNIGTGQ